MKGKDRRGAVSMVGYLTGYLEKLSMRAGQETSILTRCVLSRPAKCRYAAPHCPGALTANAPERALPDPCARCRPWLGVDGRVGGLHRTVGPDSPLDSASYARIDIVRLPLDVDIVSILEALVQG